MSADPEPVTARPPASETRALKATESAARVNAERRRIEASSDPGLPVVLVVGSPRGGSTLLAQVLTAHLPVSYPSNLTELFPRAPITATLRFARLARRRVAYTTFYGNTVSLGAPSDAFSIWNRWLGHDRYSVPDSIAPETADDMRAFFAAWSSAFGRPFMNKNNRNTAAMAVLADTIPNVRFVLVRREPVFVAQSLIEARATVQGDRRVGWGLGANPERGKSDHVDDVVDQVHRIEQLIAAQLGLVDPATVMEVSYLDLCSNPGAVVGRVGEWLDLVPTTTELEPFEPADIPRLHPTEFDRLEAVLEERLD